MRIGMLLISLLAFALSIHHVDAWFGWAYTWCGPYGKGTIADVNQYGVSYPTKYFAPPKGFADGIGLNVRFKYPMGLAVDAGLNWMYVADQGNNKIRRVSICGPAQGGDPDCVASTIKIQFDNSYITLVNPSAIAMDSYGNLYVTNDQFQILKLTYNAAIDTYIGTVYASPPTNGAFAVNTYLQGLEIDNSNNLYLSDALSHVIGRGKSGQSFVFEWCGKRGINGWNSGTVTCTNARFCHPRGIVSTASGDRLYVVDSGNRMIRYIDTATQQVVNFAGTQSCTASTYQEGTHDATSNGLLACFSNDMRGITLSNDGRYLHVVDAGFGVIRRISIIVTSGVAGKVERYTGWANKPGYTDGDASYTDLPAPYNVPLPYGYSREQVYDSQNLISAGQNFFFTDGQARIRRVITAANYLDVHHTCPATTQPPTTKAPTTKAPTTQAPTTKAPTTAAPTTKAPTTQAPTTKAPTTATPTTAAPTFPPTVIPSCNQCSRSLFGGVVDHYNVWSSGSFTGLHSDVEGAMAVGGSIDLSGGYSIGLQLQGTTPWNQLNLVVGGSLNWATGGTLYGYGAAVGGTSYPNGANVINGATRIKPYATLPAPGATFFTSQQGQISMVASQLQSNTLYGTALNACPYTLGSGSLKITGLAGDFCRVELQASSFSSVYSIDVSGPVSATVAIVIRGSAWTCGNAGFTLSGGITARSILWVAAEANTISISGITFYGSLLAPSAALTFDNGQINGQVIVSTFYGGGQVNLFLFCAGNTATKPPTTKAPTTQAPTTKAPTTQAPTTKAPTTQAPTTQAPTTKAPTTLAPTTKAPTTLAPTTKAPTTAAPTTQAPTTKAPTTAAPTTKAPTTAAPTTKAPTTAAPTTAAPTTAAPTTKAPTTAAPTTKAPTTAAPTTAAPTTKAPTTAAPTTKAPTTAAPTTAAPTTRAPTTAAPTTKAPTTAAPTTAAPTTKAPTTAAPTTNAPTTATPTTAAPTTATPTTAAPTTKAPTTAAPTTAAPTTAAPTTKAPTTPAPTTKAPTTAAPTTTAPTTQAPTTAAPTTASPTTETPTTASPSTPVPNTMAPTTPGPTLPPGSDEQCFQLLLPAEGWNVFTGSAFTFNGPASSAGRTAVGGEAKLADVSLGTSFIVPTLADMVNHVIAGDIHWQRGSQFSSLTYGGVGEFNDVTRINGAISTNTQSTIDFAARITQLTQKAADLQMAGTVQPGPNVYDTSLTNKITIRVDDAGVIANQQILLEQINALTLNELDITITPSSVLIIVVTGTGDIVFPTGLTFTGSFQSNRLLWVFPEMNTITISGIDFKGSILAPQADVIISKPVGATAGSFDGQVIAKSLFANVDFSNTLMCGTRPAPTGPPTDAPTTLPPTTSPPGTKGDPQFAGFQGQSFQIHGAPDEIFGIITSPRFQMNGNFVYLGAGHCTYKNTPCWTHPGTYIDKIGIRFPSGRSDEMNPLLNDDRIKMVAASHSHGMRVWINDEEITPSLEIHVLGSAQDNTTVVYSAIDTVEIQHPLFTMKIVNSDYFFNNEIVLRNQEWLAAGEEQILVTEENKDTAYPTDIPLHGLLGNTWKHATYGAKHMYEGDVFDYMLASGDIYGTDYSYNMYKVQSSANDEL